MFNANTFQVEVMVNGGAPFTIGPTSPAIRFRPQVPAVAPQFVNGPATPGVFGIGANNLSITPSGWTSPHIFSFGIPDSSPIISLQVYIFWNQDTGECQAYFTSSGQLLKQCSVSRSAASPARRRK